VHVGARSALCPGSPHALLCPHLPVIASNRQELAAGAPSHRLDAQGPLVGTVGRQEPAVQRVEQDLVLEETPLLRGLTPT